jgi:predicted ester cyclase
MSAVSAQNQQNKHAIWDYWNQLEQAAPAEVAALTRAYQRGDAVWQGFDPLNRLPNAEAFADTFWNPLNASLPDLKRETHIFMGGASSGNVDGRPDGQLWVGGTGLFHGTFERDWLLGGVTIPANGQRVAIRWGEFHRMEEGRIAATYCLLDLVDFLSQIGVEVLPPARGANGVWPAPASQDGVMLAAQDSASTDASRDLIRRFLFEGLNAYDQSDLSSMGVAAFFAPHVQWYGPGGIGACRSLREFEDFHQRPWLTAYPDRQVQDLDSLFAEGNYSASSGWKAVVATHSGPYLDCPATHRQVTFNGIDFWRSEGSHYVENWVFVDMLHLFRQFGVDLLARVMPSPS